LTDDRFSLRDRSRVPVSHHNSGAEVEYLLRAEEQLLRSISCGTPLPQILCDICNALNSEIGNVISLACLGDEDPTDQATIVKSAGIFGLYKFCSASIVGGNEEELGSLEMYCCVPRRPFLNEIRLIERATCLATVAIQRHKESSITSAAPSTSEL
jgi:hypothetical protein